MTNPNVLDPNVPDLQSLLNQAAETQVLSTQTLDIMAISDLGTQIASGLGVLPDDVKAVEPFLIALLIDDSGSIAHIKDGPNSVCFGQNLYLDAFINSKQTDGICMSTWLFNSDKPVQPFVLIKDAIRLEVGKNYSADGYTPLYRRLCASLGAMALELKVRYLQAGCAARGIILVVTDGYDEDFHSGKKFTADMVKTIVDDLGESLLFQFMGIEGNDNVDFHKIALDMGVQPNQIMTTRNTPHEIRELFGMASRSAISASKTTTGFSSVKVGGFNV